jgi:hypothetical protein
MNLHNDGHEEVHKDYEPKFLSPGRHTGKQSA